MAPAQERDTLEKSLKDLNLTNDELGKFEKAFKDPTFLKLFAEYAQEVSDPKAKAETDAYLRQLEEEGRGEQVYGKGVQLIAPEPSFVLKTKLMSASSTSSSAAAATAAAAGGTGGAPPGQPQGANLPVGMKVFINVCTCDKVGKYGLHDATDPATGRSGKRLEMPLTLGPHRAGKDKDGNAATVLDFVVHPDTVVFAHSSTHAMGALVESALEHVERRLGVRLSHAPKRLNTRYKATEGAERPPVQTYRTGEGGESVGGKLKPQADAPAVDVPGAKTLGSGAAAAGAEQQGPVGAAGNGSGDGKGARSTFSFDRPGQAKGRVSEVAAAKAKEPEAPADPAAPGHRHPDGSVTPQWSLVHRGETDLAEAWGDAGRNLNISTTVPKELVVRVTLPGVSSAGAVDLDVGERSLAIKVPGRYQLAMPLPYGVDDSKGRAKYDKARQVLEVTLPVVPPPPPTRPRAAQGGEAAAAAVATSFAVGSPGVDVSDDLRGIDQSSVTSSAVCSGIKGSSSGGDGGKGSGGGAAPGQAAEAVWPVNGGAEEGTSRGRGEASEDAVAVVAEGGSGQGKGEGTRETEQPQQQEEGAGEGGMTENERRWRELHARKGAEATEEEGGSGSGAGGQKGDEGAGMGLGREQKDVEGGSKEAVVEAAPAVMLRPRLNRELAMELD